MANSERLSLMAIFAHPDDESFTSGGTLAKYAADGVFTSLVVATRGEAGEISDPALASRDTLGEVREQELRLACSILGVRELRFLGYVDGTLTEIDQQEARGKMVRAIRQFRPQVVYSFGPDGAYGHPDHVTVSRLATEAYHQAGERSAYPEQFAGGLEPWSPQKLYYVAPLRERFHKLGEAAAEMLSDTSWSDRDWERFGVPEEHVTSCMDVSKYAETKLSAVFAHKTQIPANHPFTMVPEEMLLEFFSRECFVLADSRVGKVEGREEDLFRGIR